MVRSQLLQGVEALFSNAQAFAAKKKDGSVVTWGHLCGSQSCPVTGSDLASGVRTVVSTKLAFAAIKDDGSVFTWGEDNDGGDSKKLDIELCRVLPTTPTRTARPGVRQDVSRTNVHFGAFSIPG